jgi:lon-related putative ATP-dependent protease
MRELRPERLRRRLDPARLRFTSTADVPPLSGTVGQPRALEAITFGLSVATAGHNLFVAGEPGSGRTSTILDFLGAEARRRPVPEDWVYVHNFAEPDRPDAIRLPTGRGRALAADMDEFVRAARISITSAFEGESYTEREHELMADLARRREALAHGLRAFAAERDFALEITPVGVVTVPLIQGKPLTPERAASLDPIRRTEIERRKEEIEERTVGFAREMHLLAKDATERMRALEREVASFALEPLFHDLAERYAQVPDVLRYLDAVRADVLAHVSELRSEDEPGEGGLRLRSDRLARYSVNVLVDNGELEGAPVVVERSPQYRNLAGRVSYRPTLGAMVTDFREIKAGALHRANGGFLVLDVIDLLGHPFAWDVLKRALRTGQVTIESMTEEYTAVPTPALRPEPIPLTVKVILVGSRRLYRLLYELDEDFRELFRVKADFAPDMAWEPKSHRAYAAFVSRWVHENGLRHFDSSGVARLIEHGARLTQSQRKLSTRLIEIADVATEASYVAGENGHALVSAADVAAAQRRRRYRSNLAEERLHELIADGTLVIESTGARVGVVNGLSVHDLGDYAFGRPARVSARVSLGRGSVASIEREIELSGPIHSKGFLTLVGFLSATYAQSCPLALSATITFEQSYDEVEGDSASSTELFALLSALAEMPLRQDVAVTGSVDQHGRIQAVGGVNEKVEGFFAVCRARGLTGTQGVAIPAANVGNLMLGEEVVDAVRAGAFHVWAMRSVDDGLALLTGVSPGRRRRDGTFPPGTVHWLAARRLEEFAATAQAFAVAPANGDDS